MKGQPKGAGGAPVAGKAKQAAAKGSAVAKGQPAGAGGGPAPGGVSAAMNPLPRHESHAEQAKRHRAALKAARTRKRNAAKRRGISLDGVALCPAEAVAQCARLAGWPVTEADVLEIFGRCADGPSSGFTIAAALGTATRYGFGGQKLGCAFGPVDIEDELPLPVSQGLVGHVPLNEAQHAGTGSGHALILGVDLPGPHAVTVAPDGGWWSWGQPFDPADWPDMVVEEAWQVIL